MASGAMKSSAVEYSLYNSGRYRSLQGRGAPVEISSASRRRRRASSVCSRRSARARGSEALAMLPARLGSTSDSHAGSTRKDSIFSARRCVSVSKKAHGVDLVAPELGAHGALRAGEKMSRIPPRREKLAGALHHVAAAVAAREQARLERFGALALAETERKGGVF